MAIVEDYTTKMPYQFSRLELNVGFNPGAATVSAFHSDKDLAAYASGARLFAFSLASGKRLFAYPSLGNQVMLLQFLGDSLFSLTTDGAITVYESHTGRVVAAAPNVFSCENLTVAIVARIDPLALGSVLFGERGAKSLREVRLQPGTTTPTIVKYKFPDERGTEAVLSVAAAEDRVVAALKVKNARHIVMWPAAKDQERVTEHRAIKVKEGICNLISYCPFDGQFIFMERDELFALTRQGTKAAYKPPINVERVRMASPALSNAQVVGYNMFAQTFLIACGDAFTFADSTGAPATVTAEGDTPVLIRTNSARNTPGYNTFVQRLSTGVLFDFFPDLDVSLGYFSPTASAEVPLTARVKDANGITIIYGLIYVRGKRDSPRALVELPNAQVLDPFSYESREGIIKAIAQQCNINLLYSDLYDVRVSYDGFALLARLRIEKDWTYFVIDVDKTSGALVKVWPIDIDASGFRYENIASFGRIETRCFFLVTSDAGTYCYCMEVTVGVVRKLAPTTTSLDVTPPATAPNPATATATATQPSGTMTSAPAAPPATQTMGIRPPGGLGMARPNATISFAFKSNSGGTPAFAGPSASAKVNPAATMTMQPLTPVVPLVPTAAPASIPSVPPVSTIPSVPLVPVGQAPQPEARTKTLMNDGLITTKVTRENCYVAKIVGLSSTIAQLLLASQSAIYLATASLTGCAVNVNEHHVSTHYLSSSNYLLSIISDAQMDLVATNGIAIVYERYIEWLNVLTTSQGVLAFPTEFTKNRIISLPSQMRDSQHSTCREEVLDVCVPMHLVLTTRNVYLITPHWSLQQYAALPVYGANIQITGKRVQGNVNVPPALKCQLGTSGTTATLDTIGSGDLYPLVMYKLSYYCNLLQHCLSSESLIDPEQFTLFLVQMAEFLPSLQRIACPNFASFLVTFLERYMDLARDPAFKKHTDMHNKTLMKIFTTCLSKRMYEPVLVCIPALFTYHTHDALFKAEDRGKLIFNLFVNLAKYNYAEKHLAMLVAFYLTSQKTFMNSDGSNSADLFDIIRKSAAFGFSPAIVSSVTKQVAHYTEEGDIAFGLITGLLCLFEERQAYCDLCFALLAANISVSSILQYLEQVRNNIVKQAKVVPQDAVKFLDNVDHQRYAPGVAWAIDGPTIPAAIRPPEARIIAINTALFHVFGIDPATGRPVGMANPKATKEDPLNLRIGSDYCSVIEKNITRPSPYDLYRICEPDLLQPAIHHEVSSLFQVASRPLRSIDYVSNESIYPKKMFRQLLPDAISTITHFRTQAEIGKNKVKVSLAARPVPDERINAGSLADVGDGPFIDQSHNLLTAPSLQTKPLMSACGIGCFMFDDTSVFVKVPKEMKTPKFDENGNQLPPSESEKDDSSADEAKEDATGEADQKATDENDKEGDVATAPDAPPADAPVDTETVEKHPQDSDKDVPPAAAHTTSKPMAAGPTGASPQKRVLRPGDQDEDDDDWGTSTSAPKTRRITIMSKEHARPIDPSLPNAVAAGSGLKVATRVTGFDFGKPMFRPAFSNPKPDPEEEAKEEKPEDEYGVDASSLPVYDVGAPEMPAVPPAQDQYYAGYDVGQTQDQYQNPYQQVQPEENQYQQTYGGYEQSYGQSTDYNPYGDYGQSW